MRKYLLSILILAAIGLAAGRVPAIDGDYGTPYATDAGGPDAARSGSGPQYGGRNKPVPLATITGGILLLAGLGAAAYWQVRGQRSVDG